MRLVFVAACLCWLFTELFRGGLPREGSRRAQCVNSLKLIAIALHNYQAAFGCLPPAVVADERGKPMHSWRVLILPFMERQELYDRYDFREPWDGPNNIKLLNEMPFWYACPSCYDKKPTSLTNYVAITGPGTYFPGSTSARIAEDAGRLVVVEVSNAEIPWTMPRDLDISTMSLQVNDPGEPSVSSKHPNGANGCFDDYRVKFLQRLSGKMIWRP